MVVFLWFSCPPHYAMLAASAARVRDLCPSAALSVAVHRGDPLPPGQWDLVIETDFDRGRHLDGRAAAVGVAETLATVARTLGAEKVVKIDSDMFLKSADWLFEAPLAAVRVAHHYLGCYALPSPIPAAIAGSFAAVPPCSRHEANAICDRAAAFACALGTRFLLVPRSEMPGDLVQFLRPVDA